MLRLLLRLWWLQQRRNFHKRDAFVACYIIFLYVVMGVSFFLSFTENGGELGGEDMPALLGAGIVVGMLIPDIIMKMVMKRDITAMDDYVKVLSFRMPTLSASHTASTLVCSRMMMARFTATSVVSGAVSFSGIRTTRL